MKSILSIFLFASLSSFAQDSAVVTTIATAITYPITPYFGGFGPYGSGYISGSRLIYSTVRPSEKDSIPLHLVRLDTTYEWSYEYPGCIIPLPWPYPYNFDWNLTVTLLDYIYVMPSCGDTYHDNGKLSSSIECVDSVLHGKSIYWDETGHKTQEVTYHEGHMIKHKSYDSHGRMISLSHYNYAGAYHGTCITYEPEEGLKYVNRYHHGAFHGSCEKYQNDVLLKHEEYLYGELNFLKEYNSEGKLQIEKLYQNGIVIDFKYYSDAGALIADEKTNENGNLEFSRGWNEDGILILDKTYSNGVPIGVWLSDYNVSAQIRRFEYYENGIKTKYEERKKDVLLAVIDFNTKGLTTKHISYFENGDTSYYKLYNDDGETGYEKKWSELNHAKIQHEIFTVKDSISGVIFEGSGFYTFQDTIYKYSIGEQPWQCIMACYVMWNNDTVRVDYCNNSGQTNSYKFFYARNHYQYNSSLQKYVKHGRWTTYENNNLVSVENFENGMLEDRCVYYASIDDSVLVNQLGFYENGFKTNVWFDYGRNESFEINYVNGLRQGSYLKLDSNGIILVSANYFDDQLNGEYKEYFSENPAQLKTQGIYKNGFRDGEWTFFSFDSQSAIKGNYKDGIPVGKWVEYRYNENGKIKAYRIATPEPDLELSISEKNSPAA